MYSVLYTPSTHRRLHFTHQARRQLSPNTSGLRHMRLWGNQESAQPSPYLIWAASARIINTLSVWQTKPRQIQNIQQMHRSRPRHCAHFYTLWHATCNQQWQINSNPWTADAQLSTRRHAQQHWVHKSRLTDWVGTRPDSVPRNAYKTNSFSSP